METTDKKGWTKAIDVLEGMESSAQLKESKTHRYREGEVIVKSTPRGFLYLIHGVLASRATVEFHISLQIGNPYLTLTNPKPYDI